MTPLAPCSTSNVVLFPGTTFVARKNNHLTKYKSYNILGKSSRQTLSSQRFLLPLSTSVRIFSNHRSGYSVQHASRAHILAATGTDIAVEEPDSALADPDTDGKSEVVSGAVEAVETPSTAKTIVTPTSQTKRARSTRKSDMPPVSNEELVVGATFTGKVRSVQPFGAFIDFGAFTDGLVHVSQLSNEFVKDVGDIVSVGQEVKVRLLEANTENRRISLTMREGDDTGKRQPRKDYSSSSSDDKPRPARWNTSMSNQSVQETSKFAQGEVLEGTVKNLSRAGAFISLPEEEEGFLPTSEELVNGLPNHDRRSSLEVGEQVSVRVLRVTSGQITLTMKKDEDVTIKMDSELIGEVHVATNPFLMAFRKNKDIATFLDEREKLQKSTETSAPPETSEVQEQPATSSEDEINVPSAVKDVILDTTSLDNGEKEVEASAVTVDTPTTEPSSKEENPESAILNTTAEVDAPSKTVQKEDVSSTTLTSEGSVEEAPVTNDVNVNGNESDPSEEVGSDQILSSETVNNDVVVESPLDEGEKEVEASAEKVDVPPTQASSSIENEVPSNAPVEDEKVESTPETDGTVVTSVQEASSPAPQESTTKAAISPALVKHLREETGAGMMDCKKALTETGGDIVKAQEFLRKKGLASADKKASRATSEGRIGSYIHDGRIGVLLEVNCETDFVSRGDIFKELVDDLAMQVAACPQVKYVATEDVPEEIVNKEREIEMQKEDLLSKPEQIRSKIVEGRISKMVQELALLEQSYIKNDKMVVKDWVKQTIATIGENMKVKRFVRYNLGEGLEKKSQDFAAEVAAQTAAKQSTAEPAKEQPAVVEPEEVVEKPPTVTVSAALVKQLREETGAGMMDCKKALAETGGDVEKAQEFLRKKGLLTADKKSSRLAAEGRIGSYIHDSRIGVLIEVNCETDFVGRSEKFKELVDDLAMQVVACPGVQVVSIEDIPESTRNREKELEMQREDLQSKPENIREKIVEGRVSKRLGELALLEQPYIKNDSLLVKDLVKQTVAALGENIKVRRFTRFTLGEEAT